MVSTRFRRVGEYDWNQLLKDLRELDDLVANIESGSLKGEKGDPGARGNPGIDGAPGKDGAPGAAGQDGVDGADGASAYDVAVENGFEGTEAEWLASLSAATDNDDRGEIDTDRGFISGAEIKPLQRKMLTKDTVYYVDGALGNDSNKGSASAPFATIQKAVDVIYGFLDIGFYNVEIQVADGEYDGIYVSTPPLGTGTVTLTGNRTSPTEVTLNENLANGLRAIQVANGSRLSIRGLRLAGVFGVWAEAGGVVNVLDEVIIASSSTGFLATQNGVVIITGDIEIEASLSFFCRSVTGFINMTGADITLNGILTFTHFVSAERAGVISANKNSTNFFGSALGSRYKTEMNGVVYTNAGGANFFPGDVAGTAATGGQYV